MTQYVGFKYVALKCHGCESVFVPLHICMCVTTYEIKAGGARAQNGADIQHCWI